jgi:hypothetical protein
VVQSGSVVALAAKCLLLERHDLAGDECAGGVAYGPLLVAE